LSERFDALKDVIPRDERIVVFVIGQLISPWRVWGHTAGGVSQFVMSAWTEWKSTVEIMKTLLLKNMMNE